MNKLMSKLTGTKNVLANAYVAYMILFILTTLTALTANLLVA
jgi:hypothetical protein